VHARSDVPDTIPLHIGVPAVIERLGVALGRSGVGEKTKAVAPVMLHVECQPEGVPFPGFEVPLQLVDDDPGGIGVESKRADVEVFSIEQHADLGPLGQRLSFARLRLDKTRGHFGAVPCKLVEPPIEARGGRCENGPQLTGAVARLAAVGGARRPGYVCLKQERNGKGGCRPGG
jgi:hypothetical protein